MSEIPQNWAEKYGTPFAARSSHRQWLRTQATALLDFFHPRLINPADGFHVLDNSGAPLPAATGHQGRERQLHDTTRGIHCFAIASLMRRAGADEGLDHGLEFL